MSDTGTGPRSPPIQDPQRSHSLGPAPYIEVHLVEGVNDLQVPRQQLLKHGDRPALQGFRQHGVVGVGTGPLCDLPGLHCRQQVNACAPRPGKGNPTGSSPERFSMILPALLTLSQSTFSTSTRIRMSSGMDRAGWVSFS